MDKKLQKLQKAFNKLGISSEWGSFHDKSPEWLELRIIKGEKKIAIVFHSNDTVNVFETKMKKEWDDDSMKKII